MKHKKVCWFVIVGVVIVSVCTYFYFHYVEYYAYENLIFSFTENEETLDVDVTTNESTVKYCNYNLSETSDGIYKLKIKVSIIQGDDWPTTIEIKKNPQDIKAIELTDGKNSEIIYPSASTP